MSTLRSFNEEQIYASFKKKTFTMVITNIRTRERVSVADTLFHISFPRGQKGGIYIEGTGGDL